MLKQKVRNWAGIEHAELDSSNWVQMGFRMGRDSSGEMVKEYKVFGEIRGESFDEGFWVDDTKVLAYEYYEEKVSILDNNCIYCVDCGEYAKNPEFANAVSQTGGYCLDCAPEIDDEETVRYY